MEIKDYSDLTDFISTENLKTQENFGAKKASNKMMKFMEDNLIKYVKLYDKPLYRREKRKIAFDEAVDTIPHGFIWKFLHSSLWRKIKPCQQEFLKRTKKIKKPEKMEEAEKLAKKQPTTLFPEIIKPVSPPEPSSDDSSLD